MATEITERVTLIAASLLAIVGWGPLTAAKIIGETA
jgi:transposase